LKWDGLKLKQPANGGRVSGKLEKMSNKMSIGQVVQQDVLVKSLMSDGWLPMEARAILEVASKAGKDWREVAKVADRLSACVSYVSASVLFSQMGA